MKYSKIFGKYGPIPAANDTIECGFLKSEGQKIKKNILKKWGKKVTKKTLRDRRGIEIKKTIEDGVLESEDQKKTDHEKCFKWGEIKFICYCRLAILNFKITFLIKLTVLAKSEIHVKFTNPSVL